MKNKSKGCPEATIQLRRPEDSTQETQALSEYIQALPLRQREADGLIDLMLKQISAAERGAFERGFAYGADMARDTSDGLNH